MAALLTGGGGEGGAFGREQLGAFHEDIFGSDGALESGPSWGIALLSLGFGANDLCRILLLPKHRGGHEQLMSTLRLGWILQQPVTSGHHLY